MFIIIPWGKMLSQPLNSQILLASWHLFGSFLLLTKEIISAIERLFCASPYAKSWMCAARGWVGFLLWPQNWHLGPRVESKEASSVSSSRELKTIETRQWSLHSSGETPSWQTYKQGNKSVTCQVVISALRGRYYCLIFGDEKSEAEKSYLRSSGWALDNMNMKPFLVTSASMHVTIMFCSLLPFIILFWLLSH